ncbi:predicted protein [Plenodomus lingam JN3]|uniref:Predicted protein n=1 Tax=Leptosphaeria maculans (strain JN3 / isolate v23.1.3 / race Av1-4-5-6-7-8) TaxID=985895 RepID=E5A998_LEPMJ|nr:predicted protein [Plenodomus lingam JN3]CBY00239.1 predicted protein [Plenodomus lingam JN3]
MTATLPSISALEIIELQMMIFSSQDGSDLVRASLEYIEEKRKFDEARRKLEENLCKLKGERRRLKEEIQKPEDARTANPKSSVSIVVPRNTHGVEEIPVLTAMRKIDLAHLPKIKAGHTRIRVEYEDYFDALHDLSATFQGVRLPHGWPRGLNNIYCEICERFHTRLRFEHLHPAVRFLEDANICIRGQGTILLFRFCMFDTPEAQRSCYDHYCKETIVFAKDLIKAVHSMDSGGFSTKSFRVRLRPSLSHRAEHKGRFHEIVAMVNQAAITVDELMSGMDIWRPVSMEDSD